MSEFFTLPPKIRTNKYFVFKGKKHPVDFNLIKQYSNYFYENQFNYDMLTEIELSEEKIEISDEDFHNFISCCQNQKFQITENNIMQLYHLSLKYEVTDLTQFVNEYISKNSQDLIFKMIMFKQQQHLDSKTEETTMSSNFQQYINDERTLSLPIPVLYRILNDKELKIDHEEIINFLFKCLDHYGKEASILFSNFNFENKRIELYSKLITKYSNVFDFNMINPKFLMNTTNELLNDLNNLKMAHENLQNQHEDLKNEHENLRNEHENLKNKHENLKNEHENLKNKHENLKNKHENLKNEHENFLNQHENLKNEHENLEEQVKQTEAQKQIMGIDVNFARSVRSLPSLPSIVQTNENASQEKVDEAILREIEELYSRANKLYTTFKFDHENEFNGIMRYLTNKSGSNIHDNGLVEITSNSFCVHPKNVVDYQNNNFFASQNITFASICFDFKENRIKLSSYSIKSSFKNKNNEHLRSWVVEVSNDGENYVEIDSHSNDQTLNGPYKIGTFSISKEMNEFYRFIQIRQTSNSWYGYPNNNFNQFYIQFIEFFGIFEEKKE